ENRLCDLVCKTVFHTTNLNCLVSFLQYWHKGCFSCEICKMTLNMKNYKGFEKRPYCNAHYPKTNFTCVADTPENLRLKQQTKMQSQVHYKEDFEKNKGKGFSVVADTPELQRIKKTQDQISNIKYHEDFEKMKTGADAPYQPSNPNQGIYPATRHINHQRSSQKCSFRVIIPSPPYTNKQKHTVNRLIFNQFLHQRLQNQPAASQDYHQREPTPEPVREAPANRPSSGQRRYRAVYDYTAADDDEVSFLDGDMIVDVQKIDDGWMYGRVERTGQQGMLPANYVDEF
uniref:LIM and SH3 domain protein 1 n=1 Tax=Poecilia formosa TaxID=48698 RepID=A0A087X8K7_POEFO